MDTSPRAGLLAGFSGRILPGEFEAFEQVGGKECASWLGR
jgi:hypothetical protein